MIPIKFLFNKIIFLSLLIVNIFLLVYPVNIIGENYKTTSFYKQNNIFYINFHENININNSFYFFQGALEAPLFINPNFIMLNSQIDYSLDSNIISTLSKGTAIILSTNSTNNSTLSFTDRLSSKSFNIPCEHLDISIYPFEKPRHDSTLIILPEIVDLLALRGNQFVHFETQEFAIIVQTTISIREVFKDLDNENAILTSILIFTKIVEFFLLINPLSKEFNKLQISSKYSGTNFRVFLKHKYSYYALNAFIPLLIITFNDSALIVTFPLFLVQVILLIITGYVVTLKNWREQ
jgi:hypothetical protein